MKDLLQDLRHGARIFGRRPGFAAAVVLTLALGIGINSAIHAVARETLMGTLPFHDADRMAVIVSTLLDKGVTSSSVSLPELQDIRDRSRHLAGVAAFESRRSPALIGRGAAERLRNNFVTSSFFTLLSAKPLLGRTFLPEEDQGVGGHPVVILSHHLWRQRFGGDPGVIGTKIVLAEQPYTIIGVMPPEFQDIRRDLDKTDIWLPLSMGVAFYGPDMLENRVNRRFLGLTRLRGGVTMAQAQAGLDQIASQLEREHLYAHKGRGLRLVPLHTWFYETLDKPVAMLIGGAALVFLIACVNIAMLLLVRAGDRRGEVVIRTSLGASRARIVRHVLAEGIVLSLAGGLLGLLLGWAMIRVILAIGGLSLPPFAQIRLDLPLFFAFLLVSLATGLLVSLAPAARLLRTDLRSILEATSRRAQGARGTLLRNQLLVGIEVALATILLIGAGLTAKSFFRLVQTDLGFDAANLLTLRLELQGSKYQQPEALRQFTERLIQEAESIPGVRSAGVWSSMVTEANWQLIISPAGAHPDDPRYQLLTQELDVSPDTLRDLGIPLRAGREFTAADRGDPPPWVAIIGERLSRTLWPGENPIGKSIFFGDDVQRSATIVGVAGEVLHKGRLASREGLAGDVYLPFLQAPDANLCLLVRYAPGAPPPVDEIRQAVRRLDADLPLFDLSTLEGRLSRNEAPLRLSAFLMGLYALVSTVLAIVGIYGVMAYSVQQRTGEMAMRSALGARPATLRWMVMRQGVLAGLAGIVAGIAAAVPLSRLMESLLFGVSPLDLVTYATVAAGLLAVSLASAFPPAREAGSVQPMDALRHGP